MDEGFKLFSEWSLKVKGYENEPEEILKNHFYQQNQYDKILMNYQYYTTQEN